MESDGKQCRALIGLLQLERFDLPPAHQSGGRRVPQYTGETVPAWLTVRAFQAFFIHHLCNDGITCEAAGLQGCCPA